MSNIIYLNQKRVEKQYKAAGSEFTYYPELDNVQRPVKEQWTSQSYAKALMKLSSNLIK